MQFVGLSKPLTQDALDEAAAIVGIPNAVMWAVIHVESSGAGYLSDRRPKILFERHLFHRATGGQFDSNSDISNAAAGGFGAGGAHQYVRLEKAMALNKNAALGSASWGLGQVLGRNFKVAGFANVQELVTKMVRSERHQLLGMFNFIKGNNLGGHLANRKWLKFALGYNGQNAEANRYPHKLESAFNAFKSGSPPDINVRAGQLALTFLGLNPRGVDGLFGTNTRKALNRFQTSKGMAKTEKFTPADLDALFADAFAGTLKD